MAGYVLPPRQKMINLLYIILIAMLAINVSTDVMTGYDVMYKSYSSQIEKIELSNQALIQEIKRKSAGSSNANETYNNISDVTNRGAAELISMIDEIKIKIAESADGNQYVEGVLENKEDMRAVPAVLLSLGIGNKLKKLVGDYRENVLVHIKEGSDKELVKQYLNVAGDNPVSSWSDAFTSLPAIGGMVFFTKLQMDILQSESEVYRALLKEIDKKQEEEFLIKDSLFRAFLEKDKVVNDLLPVGNVSAKLMNILYAGVDNPIQITVSEMKEGELRVNMTNGTVSKENDEWRAKPLVGVTESTIILSQLLEGEETEVGRFDFNVKSLPDPRPFINYTDDKEKSVVYYGAVPLDKKYLQKITSVGALYKDGSVDFRFKVLEFEMVLVKANNTTLYESQKGENISDKQMALLKQADVGDRLYIVSVIVIGADGKKREVQPVEIVVK